MEFHPKNLSELDELTEEHLGFSALSDGLGFTKSIKRHASSESKKQGLEPHHINAPNHYQPTGATKAGPIQYAPEAFAQPKQNANIIVNNKKKSSNVLVEPAAPPGRRLLAFLFDGSVLFFPLAGAWFFSFRGDSLQILKENPYPLITFFLFALCTYFLLSESFGGQSPGKMFLRLHTVEDDKYQKPIGFRHA